MRAAIKAALAKARRRVLSNVADGTAVKDLPRVAYRIGRAIERGPNAWEIRIAWRLNRDAPPYCLAYERTTGLALVLPVIRGRFAVRVIR